MNSSNMAAVWFLNHSEAWYVWLVYLAGAAWWSWELFILLNHYAAPTAPLHGWRKWVPFRQQWQHLREKCSQLRCAVPTAGIAFAIILWIVAAPETGFLILSQESGVGLLFLLVVFVRFFLFGTFIWKLYHVIQNGVDLEQSLVTRFHKSRRVDSAAPAKAG